MRRFVKVAMPPLAATVVVPWSEPPPVATDIATLIEASLPVVTTLP